MQLKSCDPRLLHTNQKWRLIAEYMCSHICSHALIWTSGTGGPSESEGLSRTARWNMWAVIVRFEEKQSNAEGGIPVLTECRHHRGAPLFTFILSPVLYFFFFPSAQHFPSHCIRGWFSGACWQLSLGNMWPQEWAQQRKPEHSGVSRWILAFVPLQRAGFPLTQLHKLTNEKAHSERYCLALW